MAEKISTDHQNITETHDFMNVESFSQLPFIRPAPVRAEKHIRLFGIEFGHKAAAAAAAEDQDGADAWDELSSDHNMSSSVAAGGVDSGGAKEGPPTSSNEPESSRKFECHYCCRNFPTSQALGGHQNAHKRERQHAKRAHLQSALAHAPDGHHHHHPGSGPHLFLNYHRASAGAGAAFKLGTARGYDGGCYSPWNNSTTAPHAAAPAARSSSYTGAAVGSYSQPINGNPLPGLWRIPVVHHQTAGQGFNHDRSSSAHHHVVPLPLFAGEVDNAKQLGGAAGSGNRRTYESTTMTSVHHDHVSLDLHL